MFDFVEADIQQLISEMFRNLIIEDFETQFRI